MAYQRDLASLLADLSTRARVAPKDRNAPLTLFSEANETLRLSTETVTFTVTPPARAGADPAIGTANISLAS